MKVHVRWPLGKITEHSIPVGANNVVIAAPGP